MSILSIYNYKKTINAINDIDHVLDEQSNAIFVMLLCNKKTEEKKCSNATSNV